MSNTKGYQEILSVFQDRISDDTGYFARTIYIPQFARETFRLPPQNDRRVAHMSIFVCRFDDKDMYAPIKTPAHRYLHNASNCSGPMHWEHVKEIQELSLIYGFNYTDDDFLPGYVSTLSLHSKTQYLFIASHGNSETPEEEALLAKNLTKSLPALSLLLGKTAFTDGVATQL